MNYLIKYRFSILVFLIMLLAVLLRFYNYSNRWGLASDQAGFAIIAKYALATKQLPFLGPFSSAAPFQTGGEWYWILMIGTFLFPHWVIGPWVFLSLLSLIFVIITIFVSQDLIDRRFSIITGILAAISTAEISQSTNLTNQTPIALFSLLLIWSSIKALKTKKLRYVFLAGISIGVASTIHFQGIALFPIIFLLILFGSFNRVNSFCLAVLGILIPWLPVVYIDLHHGFYNTKNIIYYIFLEKNRIPFEALGRRWLTFLAVFVPNSWASIAGGIAPFGYVSIFGVIATAIYAFVKKTLTREWILMLAGTAIMFIIVRYTRTPLYDSYLMFVHPFVILLTGWFLYALYLRNKIIGLVILSFFIASLLYRDFGIVTQESNLTQTQASYWTNKAIFIYPSETFSVYDYKYTATGKSLPFVLFLYTKSKISSNGKRIGFGSIPKKIRKKYPTLFSSQDGYQIIDLNQYNSDELIKQGWVSVNPSSVYNSTENWYNK